MIEKILKGLFLAALFGGITFLITKDVGTAGLIALVMFMSMFVQTKEQKMEKVSKYTNQSSESKK